MLTQSLILALGLIGAVSASTAVKAKTCLDTYDNVTTAGGQIISGATIALTHAGYQNNLNYNQFAVGAPGATAGLVAQSKPNFIAVAAPTSAQSGSVSTNPSSTVFKSGAIKYFTVLEFYFGCVTDALQADASVATGCTIAVTGVDITGNMVGSQTFSFAPKAVEGQALSRAVLSASWASYKLANLTFGISGADLGPINTVLNIDNLMHVNYE